MVEFVLMLPEMATRTEALCLFGLRFQGVGCEEAVRGRRTGRQRRRWWRRRRRGRMRKSWVLWEGFGKGWSKMASSLAAVTPGETKLKDRAFANAWMCWNGNCEILRC